MNMTWGGLPASVPPGYIAYFVLPAVIGAALGRTLSSRFQWRRPITLLSAGLFVGCVWALLFNAVFGAHPPSLGLHYGPCDLAGKGFLRLEARHGQPTTLTPWWTRA
jgi:hypothetical protein